MKKIQKNIFSGDHKMALMFVKSLNKYFANRINSRKSAERFNPGDIYFAHMLLGYEDESAFEHPVLILGKGKGSLFVVPTSSNKKRIDAAYNPISKEGEENLVKIEFELDETNGFTKKILDEYKNKNIEIPEVILSSSVFQLNNAQMISTNRITGTIYGKVKTPSDGLKYAYEYTFKMMFEKYYDELILLRKENEIYKKNFDEIEEYLNKLLFFS